MKTPDAVGAGFAASALDPLRYNGLCDDPWEAPAILNAMMPSGARVLDVGCGSGPTTLVANHGKGNDVWGIEPDPDRAETARARGLNVSCGYLTDSYFVENGTFDVIMFADVLEHVPDPAGLLKMALTGLRSDGFILISVPNVAHWTVRWQLARGRFDYMPSGIRDATHLRWFTQRTLQHLLESVGLEVVDFRHSSGAYTPDYQIFPWKNLSQKWRNRGIHVGTRLWPRLFGCQHVVKARRVAGKS